MPTSDNEITASIWVQYAWHRGSGPDPAKWRSADEWADARQAAAREWDTVRGQAQRTAPALTPAVSALNDRFGTTRRVREQREGRSAPRPSSWPGWYGAQDMIAIAMGAPEPLWINGMWWHDRNHYALEHMQSVAELGRLTVPDWCRIDCVQRMLDSRDRWHGTRPDEPASGFGIVYDTLAVPGRGEAAALCYPSFVDLGVFLMGATRFLAVLAGEPELADAFMELCFELSVGYIEFLFTLHPESFVGLCGFGGDATFFLSPHLYERYSAAWDARLFERVRSLHGLPETLPCNLHSCGASAHLYDRWRQHPYHGNITALQTRLIPGEVGRLRESLPHTQLELTLHPPEFDLVTAEAAAVREILGTSARDAGNRNVHFLFIATPQRPEDLSGLARNVQVCVDEMERLTA